MVKFLDFRKLYTAYQDEIDTAMKVCLTTGKLILQDDVDKFEERLAKYLGVKYVVGLNSGTDALLLALAAAGVGEGDEVITVSHTFVATIQVIHHLNAQPVLVDVGEDGLLNPENLPITDKTKAIIPVHLMGDYVPKFDSKVTIIEDAAQALGAKGVGYGQSQCYSFYPAKILGCFGDGGALATNDKGIADRVRSLRNHGNVQKTQQDRYEFGWNSRLDNIQAAVLNVKLDYLDIDLKRREEIANQYLEAFKDLDILLPPKHEGRVWQDFIIRFEDMKKRDEVKRKLDNKMVETLGSGQLPPHRHLGLGLDHYNLPNTDDWVFTGLRIPCNQFMTQEDVSEVIHAIQTSV